MRDVRPSVIDPDSRVLLYDSGTQGVKLRVLGGVFVVLTAASVAGEAVVASNTPGLPAAYAEPRNVSLQLLLAASLVFGACAALLVLYTHCYVRVIDQDAGNSNRFRFETLGMGLGPPTEIEVSKAELDSGTYHQGSFVRRGIDALWYTVRVPRRWLSLVIDVQGTFRDVSGAQVPLEDADPADASDTGGDARRRRRAPPRGR